MWNMHAIDYKNFTASYKNFTVVSSKMDPNNYMHYIESLKLAPYLKWNTILGEEDTIFKKLLDFRMRTLTLWQGDF